MGDWYASSYVGRLGYEVMTLVRIPTSSVCYPDWANSVCPSVLCDAVPEQITSNKLIM